MGSIRRAFQAWECWALGEDAISDLPRVERRRIGRRITPAVLRHPLTIAGLGYTVAAFVVVLGTGLLAEDPYASSMVGLRLAVQSGYLVVIPGIFLSNRHIRRRAIQRLIDAGEIHLDYCHGCHYDLRGTPGPRCPECGWRRDREV